MSDPDWNDLLKGTIITAVSLVPDVGPFLGVLVDVLWPKQGDDYMDNVKAYVDSKLAETLKKTLETLEANNLRHEIIGLEALMKSLTDPSQDPDQYKSTMNTLKDKTLDIKERFTDSATSPADLVIYLTAFGTIRLGVLREIYHNYSHVYPHDSEQTRRGYIKTIQDEAKEFTSLIVKGRADAIAARKSDVWIDYTPRGQTTVVIEGPYSMPARPGAPEKWTVRDKGDPSYQREFGNQTDAKWAGNDRVDLIEYLWGGSAYLLDDLIDPYRYWKFMDPTVTAKPEPGLMYTYIRLGSYRQNYVDFNHANSRRLYGPISRITIWVDTTGVTGMEVLYGGVSAGMAGAKANGSWDWILGNTVVTQISGRDDGRLRRFFFNTNGRRSAGQGSIGGGTSETDNFTYDWCPNNDVTPATYRLSYFQGMASASGGIARLTTVWERLIDYNGDLGSDHTMH